MSDTSTRGPVRALFTGQAADARAFLEAQFANRDVRGVICFVQGADGTIDYGLFGQRDARDFAFVSLVVGRWALDGEEA